MQEPPRATRQRVAILRRTAVWLAIATLLALPSGQLLHPGAASAAQDAVGVSASLPGVDPVSQHAGAHLPGLCSICRAIGQARVGLYAPTIAEAGCTDVVGLLAARARFDAAPRACWLAPCGPRAPPDALPIGNA
jgi:hypothetical protein